MAMASVDLRSCYDRIGHVVATLALRSIGIPRAPLESMLSTIQNTQFHPKTHHGVSEMSFGGQEMGYTSKPNGICQGNGCGPQVWSSISSKMFQVLHKNNCFSTIKAPLSDTILNLAGFAYVDDTDLVINLQQSNDLVQAREKMQRAVDIWEEVTKTTGGALEPKKCCCWIVGFNWKQGQWTYANLEKKGIKEINTKDKDDNNNCH